MGQEGGSGIWGVFSISETQDTYQVIVMFLPPLASAPPGLNLTEDTEIVPWQRTNRGDLGWFRLGLVRACMWCYTFQHFLHTMDFLRTYCNLVSLLSLRLINLESWQLEIWGQVTPGMPSSLWALGREMSWVYIEGQTGNILSFYMIWGWCDNVLEQTRLMRNGLSQLSPLSPSGMTADRRCPHEPKSCLGHLPLQYQ